MNDNGYAPLLVNLEGYWDKTLDELPSELIAIVEKAFVPFSWDSLDVANRHNIAAQHDYRNDPKHEYSLYFELSCFAEELKGWIEKARQESKDAAVVALLDVAVKIEKIADIDRNGVGTKLQEWRADHNRVVELRSELATKEEEVLERDGHLRQFEEDTTRAASEIESLQNAQNAKEQELTNANERIRQLEDEKTRADRDYVSDRLATMNQAATKFWANAEQADRGTHPVNAEVEKWLTESGFSQTLAEKAATIIRPKWASTGRKPEK